jgi:branched-chain amino acid transport system ATP-binding protein
VSEIALETRGLRKRFGGVEATADVSLSVSRGSVHALIGPNGAGKTTLVALLSGELAPNAGKILHNEVDVTHLNLFRRCKEGIARSYQIASLFNEYTALENILLAVLSREGRGRNVWRNVMGDSGTIRNAQEVLAQVGLLEHRDVPAKSLAHGQQRQLEVGMTLAAGAQILLLDEPLAGTGAAEANEIIELIQRLKGRLTVVLIEHDMEAVFALADRISVLVYGKLIATGTPEEIKRNPHVREAYLGEQAD